VYEGSRGRDRPESRSWSLWRMDDNGNRFEVSRHPSKEAALRAASELEARGHKQLYSVHPARRAKGFETGSRSGPGGERDEQ
jgi:hypothetical protein